MCWAVAVLLCSLPCALASCPLCTCFVHLLRRCWMHPSKIAVVCCEVAAGVLCRAGTVCRQDSSQVGQVDVKQMGATVLLRIIAHCVSVHHKFCTGVWVVLRQLCLVLDMPQLLTADFFRHWWLYVRKVCLPWQLQCCGVCWPVPVLLLIVPLLPALCARALLISCNVVECLPPQLPFLCCEAFNGCSWGPLQGQLRSVQGHAHCVSVHHCSACCCHLHQQQVACWRRASVVCHLSLIVRLSAFPVSDCGKDDLGTLAGEGPHVCRSWLVVTASDMFVTTAVDRECKVMPRQLPKTIARPLH
jgi:hypothetical protein